MKKRFFALTGFMASILLVSGLLLHGWFEDIDPREEYEQFILNSADMIGHMDDTMEGEDPGEDQPEMAAYEDFIKVVDPSLKRFPVGRNMEAYLATKQAEKLKSTNGQLTWTDHPTNMGGRTRVIVFDPNDSSGKRVFAGAVTGGLWTNDDFTSDNTWTPVNDLWPNLSISSMAFDPNNPQVCYLGTGESQTALIIYRESSNRGIGVMKSTDGGSTWELIPSTKEWAYVTDLVVRNEGGTSIIYAGVVSGIYQGKIHESGPSDGLYRSVDGGITWTQVLPMVSGSQRPYAPSDIELSSDGARIFVGTTYHGEDRAGAACILSSDDGLNWSVMSTYGDRLSTPEIWDGNQVNYEYPGRVMLSASRSDANVLYAAVSGGYMRGDQFVGYDCRFLLKSTDKGGSWTEVNPPPFNGTGTFANLAWHAMAITVDPADPNTFWVGGLDVWRTRDNGDNWQHMSFWAPGGPDQQQRYVHADIHMIVFQPGSTSKLLVGTDGGVFYSRQAQDEVPVFEERNQHYSTLQYYAGAIHSDPTVRYFMGGLQDNGTLLYYGDEAPGNNNKLSGGDGAYCFFDDNEPNIYITTVYYTSLYIWDIVPGDHGALMAASNKGVGTFINPMDYDWKYNILYTNGVSFSGYNANTLGVYRINGNRVSGGLQELPTGSNVPFSSVKWFVDSGLDASVVYLGTQAGKFFRLEDAPIPGALTDLTSAEFPTAYISSSDIGQSEDTLLVTFSNYGVESVWYSTNGGQDWKNIEGNLPDMPVRWGILHPQNGRQIMLATETGIWTTLDALADPVIWTPDVEGMANVRVDMLRIRRSDNTILAATHGRGMFTTIWEPNFSSGIPDGDVVADELKIYPNPSTGKFDLELIGYGKVDITVMDLTGRVVIHEIINEPGRVIKGYNLSDEPKGIYLVDVTSGLNRTTKKILIFTSVPTEQYPGRQSPY